MDVFLYQNIFHGALSMDQLFLSRPVSGDIGPPAPFTPINKLLCGSGAHPGGGVTGAPGYIAAQAGIALLLAMKSKIWHWHCVLMGLKALQHKSNSLELLLWIMKPNYAPLFNPLPLQTWVTIPSLLHQCLRTFRMLRKSMNLIIKESDMMFNAFS